MRAARGRSCAGKNIAVVQLYNMLQIFIQIKSWRRGGAEEASSWRRGEEQLNYTGALSRREQWSTWPHWLLWPHGLIQHQASFIPPPDQSSPSISVGKAIIEYILNLLLFYDVFKDNILICTCQCKMRNFWLQFLLEISKY